MKEHIDVSLKMVDNFHVLLEHFVFIDEKNQTPLCLKLIVMFERHVLIKICR